jgi:glycosyltransferase involved in cell wall biosynthesis
VVLRQVVSAGKRAPHHHDDRRIPYARARPLKVVQAVTSNAFAGVERYIVVIAEALARRRHSVVVVGGHVESMGALLAIRGVSFVPASRALATTAQLCRTARDADVVHVHMTAAEAAATAAWPAVRAPVVATRHFAAKRGSTRRGHVASKLISRRVSAEIAISEYVASAVKETTDVILHGVKDDAPVDPIEPVVLVAQRLEAEKHTRVALEAWRQSRLAAAGWRLLIAGGGTERPKLEEYARQEHLQRVEFLGHRPDLAELRKFAGIFLATTPEEGFGFGVAEAMAAGLPVIAASGGGHLETVGAVRPDLLYDPGSPSDCARVLRELARDIAKRRAAGSDLRRFQQEQLTMDRHVEALLGVYSRVIRADTPTS